MDSIFSQIKTTRENYNISLQKFSQKIILYKLNLEI